MLQVDDGEPAMPENGLLRNMMNAFAIRAPMGDAGKHRLQDTALPGRVSGAEDGD
jgi:hypothetical protein